MREERFIIKVVEMHYKQGMSQQEIGKRLNVSRTTISRILAQARREGYVQIKINYPEDATVSLEKQLEEKYGLKEAVIASVQNKDELADEIAFYASDYHDVDEPYDVCTDQRSHFAEYGGISGQ